MPEGVKIILELDDVSEIAIQYELIHKLYKVFPEKSNEEIAKLMGISSRKLYKNFKDFGFNKKYIDGIRASGVSKSGMGE